MAAAAPDASAAAAAPLFGLLPAGHPLVTSPTSQPTPTSFLYALQQPSPPAAAPAAAAASPADQQRKPFSHLAVFLLPGVALPDGTAAAIYLARDPAAVAAGAAGPDSFRFLGGVGPGKESAVFKVGSGAAGDVVVVGVSVEDAGSVAQRIQEQQQQQSGGGGAQQQQQQQQAGQQPTTQVLAQRIIQNAFNFLSSFSGDAGGTEVVPLRAFQDWWRKFEGRVRSDPTFLERPQE